MVDVAQKQSDEDIEEALETMEENEKDEILELVGEAKLKKPQPMDAVVQYCTSKCKEEKNWKQLKAYPVQVTFNTAPAYDGPSSKCRNIKPIGKNDWVAVDISEWMREWVTNPKSNFGVMFFPPGSDNIGFVSQLDPDANERPRLSLSCHGDRVDYDHVFKEKKGSLRRVAPVHLHNKHK